MLEDIIFYFIGIMEEFIFVHFNDFIDFIDRFNAIGDEFFAFVFTFISYVYYFINPTVLALVLGAVIVMALLRVIMAIVNLIYP